MKSHNNSDNIWVVAAAISAIAIGMFPLILGMALGNPDTPPTPGPGAP